MVFGGYGFSYKNKILVMKLGRYKISRYKRTPTVQQVKLPYFGFYVKIKNGLLKTQ